MKINRFVGLAAIAVLVVAVMGFVSMRVSAQGHDPVAPAGAHVEDDDTSEAAETGPDVDDVEEQSGQQDEADEAGDLDNGEVENEADDVSEAGVEDELEDAPSGTPSITAEVARQAAEGYVGGGATATEVELEADGGRLVYSVEINGSDVNVDALTGEVLGVESGDD